MPTRTTLSQLLNEGPRKPLLHLQKSQSPRQQILPTRMLPLGMPPTIILPIKANSREWTVHIRTSEKGPRKEFRMAALFVSF